MASSGTQFDSDCILMLHMDGADEATDFTDSSAVAKTVAASGNAQIDTGQVVTGFDQTGKFDGTGDFLTITDHADFDFGTGDFTIDFRIRLAVSEDYYVLNGAASSSTFIRVEVDSLNNRVVVSPMGSTSQNFSYDFGVDTWYHVAIVKIAGVYKVFVNGTQIGADWADTTSISSSGDIRISGTQANQANLNGWLDEFRIVSGTAVWTSDFTAPTAAYTSGGGSFVKKALTVAYASLKKVSTVAIASVKKIGTIA